MAHPVFQLYLLAGHMRNWLLVFLPRSSQYLGKWTCLMDYSIESFLYMHYQACFSTPLAYAVTCRNYLFLFNNLYLKIFSRYSSSLTPNHMDSEINKNMFKTWMLQMTPIPSWQDEWMSYNIHGGIQLTALSHWQLERVRLRESSSTWWICPVHVLLIYLLLLL